MQANDPPRRLGFGVFEVDLRERQLTKRGLRIRLQEQPFQVLAMLLERPGEVVTRDELRNRLWPNTVVEFDHGLNKAISKIREVLGDSVESPRFIETVPRRGYRFIAPIEQIGGATFAEPTVSDEHPIAIVPVSDGARNAVRKLPRKFITSPRFLALAVMVGAILVFCFVFVPLRLLKKTNAQVEAPATRSIAVLPLENLSGNPGEDYFADGLTDELITPLAKTTNLRVISRTSVMQFKNVRKPVGDIARQ